MERIYTNYTASGRQIVLSNVPTSFSAITVENVRLIFNETQKDEQGNSLDPLASTGCKENILSVTYNGTAKTVTIVLADTVPVIASTDKLTIKIDMGDGLENPNATLTAILEALQGSDTPSSDIPEGVAERLALILEYFGIKPISDYEFMTDTEVCDELEDIMRVIDPNLTAEQAAAITAQTLNPSES